MARTISQAERIEGERQHAAATPASVVDRYYRLQPADLGGTEAAPRTVVVRLVGSQGVEQPAPVLHLTGIVKPLLLDAANVAALARIAASQLQRDWTGREIVLGVVQENRAPVIRIFAPGDPAVAVLRRKSQRAARARTAALWLRQLLRYSLVLLVLLLLGAGALYLFENWSILLELATTMIEGLLNPS